MSTTGHQPKGNYPRPAEIHHVDLKSESEAMLAKLPGRRHQGKNLAREGGLSVLLVAMEPGAEMDEHSAAGTASIHVLQGRIALTTGEETLSLGAGEVAMYQPHVRHGVRAEEQSVFLLTVAERSLDG